jgi:hypothetical protein
MDENESYQILLNKDNFSLLSVKDLEEGHILLNKISTLKDSFRSVFYRDRGIIVENSKRTLFLDIPFIREDFKLDDLEFETIKKNIHVQNCLRTKCTLPFDRMLSNGYSEANFILEKDFLNVYLIHIAFIINFNQETTENNYMEKIEIATKEDTATILKTHLLYNQFIFRSQIIENSYDFLTEFYKEKNQIKLSEEEAAKKPFMLSLKKEYPAKFNHLILGYEEMDIFFSHLENTSKTILNILMEDLSKLKIKYLYRK